MTATTLQFPSSSPRNGQPWDVPALVDEILAAARDANASDVHLCPTADGLEMKWRLDGVLQPVSVFPRGQGPQVIARLKVLAELLTYRTDLPQEGRLRPWRDDADKPAAAGSDTETRLSTFPTLFGEKAVIRMFAGAGRYRSLDELGLPGDTLGELQSLLHRNGGVVLFTGPAGSGKTTTAYACLREIVAESAGGRSVVSLEDPIEVVVPGVDQSQVNSQAGFNLATGLKSLLRQDPNVILVGEIRDRETAETVFQASLTGHLVLTTFHAGSAAQAVSRLADMGIEPYLLRSGLQAILCQRLMRTLCDCGQPSQDEAAKCGLPVDTARVSVGCETCNGTGYRGRAVVSEFLRPQDGKVGPAILSRQDAGELERLAKDSGMQTQRDAAMRHVTDGATSTEEFLRVFGGRE